jgi:hypothetical protein
MFSDAASSATTDSGKRCLDRHPHLRGEDILMIVYTHNNKRIDFFIQNKISLLASTQSLLQFSTTENHLSDVHISYSICSVALSYRRCIVKMTQITYGFAWITQGRTEHHAVLLEPLEKGLDTVLIKWDTLGKKERVPVSSVRLDEEVIYLGRRRRRQSMPAPMTSCANDTRKNKKKRQGRANKRRSVASIKSEPPDVQPSFWAAAVDVKEEDTLQEEVKVQATTLLEDDDEEDEFIARLQASFPLLKHEPSSENHINDSKSCVKLSPNIVAKTILTLSPPSNENEAAAMNKNCVKTLSALEHDRPQQPRKKEQFQPSTSSKSDSKNVASNTALISRTEDEEDISVLATSAIGSTSEFVSNSLKPIVDATETIIPTTTAAPKPSSPSTKDGAPQCVLKGVPNENNTSGEKQSDVGQAKQPTATIGMPTNKSDSLAASTKEPFKRLSEVASNKTFQKESNDMAATLDCCNSFAQSPAPSPKQPPSHKVLDSPQHPEPPAGIPPISNSSPLKRKVIDESEKPKPTPIGKKIKLSNDTKVSFPVKESKHPDPRDIRRKDDGRKNQQATNDNRNFDRDRVDDLAESLTSLTLLDKSNKTKLPSRHPLKDVKPTNVHASDVQGENLEKIEFILTKPKSKNKVNGKGGAKTKLRVKPKPPVKEMPHNRLNKVDDETTQNKENVVKRHSLMFPALMIGDELEYKNKTVAVSATTRLHKKQPMQAPDVKATKTRRPSIGGSRQRKVPKLRKPPPPPFPPPPKLSTIVEDTPAQHVRSVTPTEILRQEIDSAAPVMASDEVNNVIAPSDPTFVSIAQPSKLPKIFEGTEEEISNCGGNSTREKKATKVQALSQQKRKAESTSVTDQIPTKIRNNISIHTGSSLAKASSGNTRSLGAIIQMIKSSNNPSGTGIPKKTVKGDGGDGVRQRKEKQDTKLVATKECAKLGPKDRNNLESKQNAPGPVVQALKQESKSRTPKEDTTRGKEDIHRIAVLRREIAPSVQVETALDATTASEGSAQIDKLERKLGKQNDRKKRCGTTNNALQGEKYNRNPKKRFIARMWEESSQGDQNDISMGDEPYRTDATRAPTNKLSTSNVSVTSFAQNPFKKTSVAESVSESAELTEETSTGAGEERGNQINNKGWLKFQQLEEDGKSSPINERFPSMGGNFDQAQINI